MTPQQQIARGETAQRYLEDPLIQEAFGVIQDALHDQWEQSPAKDAQGREAAYFMLKCFREFRSFFESVIAEGEFAKEEIERLAKRHIKNTRR